MNNDDFDRASILIDDLQTELERLRGLIRNWFILRNSVNPFISSDVDAATWDAWRDAENALREAIKE